MPATVTIKTATGRILHGISYIHATVPTDHCSETPCPVFASSLNGGTTYGSFSMRGPMGWLNTPARIIVASPDLSMGAQT